MNETRLTKDKQGYGYKYTDLAQINEWCEEHGVRYWQETETRANGKDYIITHVCDENYSEVRKVNGCEIPQVTLQGKSNSAQELGSALTYARRYSLSMALGLASEDDDGEACSKPTKPDKKPKTEHKSNYVADDLKRAGFDPDSSKIKEAVYNITSYYIEQFGEEEQDFWDTNKFEIFKRLERLK